MSARAFREKKKNNSGIESIIDKLIESTTMITLANLELVAVGTTMAVFVLLLNIALGIHKRGTSEGVPIKNFLSGVIMCGLTWFFTDPAKPTDITDIQNNCGLLVQLYITLVILNYSSNLERDLRYCAIAAVIFSVLMNFKENALLVMTLWNFLHFVLLPGNDYIASRSQPTEPADLPSILLGVFALLSQWSWGIIISISGMYLMATPLIIGGSLSVASLKIALLGNQPKTKTA